MKLTDYQMDVMCNILAAVETGGQVYGQGRWDDFTEAGKNSSNEKAITIGCYQFYGTNAQLLLSLIRKSYPAKFKELDTVGIASDLDNKNWSVYKLSKTSDKAKCIQRIIGSEIGISTQKTLIGEQITTYINRAVTEGVTDVQAAMFCANIQHLGGKAPVQRIIKKTGSPLTIDRIYATLKLDQQDTSNDNQVGDNKYWSRHVKVYGWIKEYVKEESMAINVVLAGHGSGKPSTKGMNAYCQSRQAAGRGLVEVRRLNLTDAQRQQMHDLYRTILGRNNYSQSLRDYCYMLYRGSYYSDCSSSICRTAQKVGVSGVATLNTAGMHYDWQKVSGIIIKNGIIQNPELLKVGDALMFKGSDPKRPLGIGHTEMVYEIDGQTAAGATPTVQKGKEVVAAGQMHANNFTGAGLKVDGERGALTIKAGIMCVQLAMNLDYKAGLVVDGIWGPKSEAALAGHYVKIAEVQYMVTALEILFMLRGYNPGGVECPGVFGSGLDKTVRDYKAEKKWQANGTAGVGTFKSLMGV